MRMTTTKGETIKINLRSCRLSGDSILKSKFQKEVAEQIKKIYPHDIIYYEVYVPKDRLYLDFFIPTLGMVVECDGIQHDSYVPFFHGDFAGFAQQKDRDYKKLTWCKLNNLVLIRIKYGQSFASAIQSL